MQELVVCMTTRGQADSKHLMLSGNEKLCELTQQNKVKVDKSRWRKGTLTKKQNKNETIVVIWNIDNCVFDEKQQWKLKMKRI